MGNNQSVDASQRTANYSHGNHVIKVAPGSPGERGGLIPFFDYLVEANGVLLDKDNVLIDFLSVSTGKEIKLVIYNSKREDYRETIISPEDWSGQSKLGVSVRFSEIRPNMMEFVWHILEIHPNSPASEAGLIAAYDYIVGTAKSPFLDSEDFFNLVSRNHLKAIELYVYNVITDKVRIVTLTPNPSWGGDGCLGCEIGFGLLHRLPSDETRKLILKKYEEEIPKTEPFPDYSVTPKSTPLRPNVNANNNQNILISHIPQLPSTPIPNPYANPNNNNIINNNNILAQNPLLSTPPPQFTPIQSTPVQSAPIQSTPYQPTPLQAQNNNQGAPQISQVAPISQGATPISSNPNVFVASPYYPQISSPYKPPSVPSSLPSTPLANLSSPSPSPLTPISSLGSPIAGSPSLETLQRLKEKQAQLQEQLKSIQLNSPTLAHPMN